MELVRSNIGKHDKFYFNGYEYVYSRSSNNTDYYFCSEFYSVIFFKFSFLHLSYVANQANCQPSRYKKQSKCKGRLIHYKNQNTFKESGNHLHAPDSRTKKKCKLLNTLKDKANTDHKKSRELVGEVSSLANVAVKPVLPSCAQMMRIVQRERKKKSCPTSPANLNVLVLPEEYMKTLDDKNFLIFDSGPGDERLMIFSTEENLNELARCTSIHMDGTFNVAPILFTQLYTIHGEF